MPESTRTDLSRARGQLLAELSREVMDERVLDALRRVPRERFVPDDLRSMAYDNLPLPIGYGQTISQPSMVAIMTQALQLGASDTVLEIGTGSGYQAALLSLLAQRVVTTERVPPLADEAKARLAEPRYSNVEVHVSEDSIGWVEGAPYDAIAVTAGAPEVPMELIEQLADGGRLVIPVGSRALQELVRITKTPEGAIRNNLGGCRFVPLLGESAWPDQPSKGGEPA
ncbi:MAG: protein-L-isoaspartate(D-aspartate) O-methyltransferase [Chloroflexi bacterium]|nr:protein-L-isoaspartate(D-aspartate) O-methyltransferase [Chloroflexota bacterium]